MKANYIVLGLIAVLLLACTTTTTTVEDSNDAMPSDGSDTNAPDMDAVDDSMGDVPSTPEDAQGEPDHVFVITGENFAYFMDGVEAPELRVKEGDIVRIEFTSTDGFHDWVVDEFDAATEKVRAPGSTSVQFVADTKGTFEYYCSVGQHRANGMVGNLVVE